MAVKRAKQRKLRHLLTPFLCAVLISYIGYHTLTGPRGLTGYLEAEARLHQIQTEEAKLSSKREGLERKVSRMRPDNLDLDLLDEQARAILGYADRNELVYIYPEEEK